MFDLSNETIKEYLYSQDSWKINGMLNYLYNNIDNIAVCRFIISIKSLVFTLDTLYKSKMSDGEIEIYDFTPSLLVTRDEMIEELLEMLNIDL